MHVTVTFDSRRGRRWLDQIHKMAVKKATPSTINRSLSKLKTRVKRRISQKTGVSQKSISDLITIQKASANHPVGKMTIRDRTPNAIRFGARETRKHLSVRTFRKRQTIKTGFIGNAGRTAFRREPGAKRLPIRPVYGPNVARAFGAPKNMAVYKRYARITMNKEFEGRYNYFRSRLRR